MHPDFSTTKDYEPVRETVEEDRVTGFSNFDADTDKSVTGFALPVNPTKVGKDTRESVISLPIDNETQLKQVSLPVELSKNKLIEEIKQKFKYQSLFITYAAVNREKKVNNLDTPDNRRKI